MITHTIFPGDTEVKQMGRVKFIELYMSESYIKEYGNLEGFDEWKQLDSIEFNRTANNAVDIYEGILDGTL